MDFNNKYNKNLKHLYSSREEDFEIFFLNLLRFIKYFNLIDVNDQTNILDLGSADNSLQKIAKK